MGKMKKSKGKPALQNVAEMRSHAAAVAPRIAVAIMAAGKGTRLKSQLPKVFMKWAESRCWRM